MTLLSRWNFPYRPLLISLASVFGLGVSSPLFAADDPEASKPAVQVKSWSMQYETSSHCSGDTCEVTVNYHGNPDMAPEVTINGQKVNLPQKTAEDGSIIRSFTTTVPRNADAVQVHIPDTAPQLLPPMLAAPIAAPMIQPVPDCPDGWYPYYVNITSGEYECRLRNPVIQCPAGQEAFSGNGRFGCRVKK